MSGSIDLSQLTLVHGGKRFVILDLSTPAADAALDVLGAMMSGGAIELLDDSDELLCSLPLSDPAAGPAIDGELTFAPIDAGIAVTQGTAATARIVGVDGTEVLTCDVGDLSSDAVIRLNTVAITAGEAVLITAFRLSMP